MLNRLREPVVRGFVVAAIASAAFGFSLNAQQNVVRLWENTLLGLDKLTSMETGAEMVTETELDLKAGDVAFADAVGQGD